MDEKIEEILSYWFGKLSDGQASEQNKALWYSSTPEQDQQMSDQFGMLHALAAKGELHQWQKTPRGSLALVILLDQMSRNMFRGTANAFAYDQTSLGYALEGIQKGFDAQLSTVEAVFYYHPLEHSENLAHQDLCVEKMKWLIGFAPGSEQAIAENGLQWAIEHRDIIAQFGRFPHRNEVMGRTSTKQEKAYLSGGGKRFGQ